MYCCVKNCLNKATTKPNISLGITFHKFHKAAWVKALASAGCQITKTLVVCSEHFLPEDFDDTLPNRRRVKSGVVPTLLTLPDPAELKVCRVCLALDVKMYDLKDYKLSEMFQNVTGISDIDQNDSALQRVCWECTARLTAAAAFRDKALLSDALLQDLVHITKSDIVTLKQHYSSLKSTLTAQTIFSPSDIAFEDFISVEKETEKNLNDVKAIEKSNTKLKVNEEEKAKEVQFQEHEPWIDVPVKTEIKSDPIAVNSFNIRFQDQNSDIFSEETDETSMMNDDKSEVQMGNNVIENNVNEISREATDNYCIANNEDDTSNVEDKEYTEKQMSVEVEEKSARLSTRMLQLGLEMKKQASGVPAAKKPKLDPQKDNSDHSLSPKRKNKGQEQSKTSETTKKSTLKPIRESKKCISSKTVVQNNPQFCHNTICNYEDNLETKIQENTESLQNNSVHKDEFNCELSDFKGINSSDVLRHDSKYNNVSDKNKHLVCDICQNSFIYKSVLIRHIRTHTGEKPYKCYICHSSFNQKTYLKRHIHLHSGEKPHKCDICQSSFSEKGHLNTHIRTHTGEKPHKCDFCQGSFSKKGDLKAHIRTHTGERPYKCDICQISFGRKGYLKAHVRTHTGEKPYKCDICQKSFRVKGHLNIHILIHTGEKPHKCDICQSSYRWKRDLKAHIRTHTGERPYKCDLCQSSFSRRSSLKAHVRRHTGEKPHKCNICKRSFFEKGQLNTHIRTHTGEKPYKCNICQISFCQKSQLKTHIRTHTREKPHKCNICQSSFNTKGDLNAHNRKHTGEKPYKCDICLSSFRVKGHLTTHIRTHTGEKPHKCDICQRSFGQKSNLKIHIRKHTGEQPYKCDICQRSFSNKGNLKTHIRTHTGEKPYKCDICQRSFSQMISLKIHIRTHTGVKPYNCVKCHKRFSNRTCFRYHVQKHH